MRVPAFPIVASLVLLAAPVFAQNGAMAGTTGDQNGNTGYMNNGASGYSNGASGYSNGGAGYNNGMNGAYNGQTGQTGQTGTNNGTAAGGQGWGSGANVSQDTRARIRQSLTQSGFRNVTVMPEAFVIHATSPDGSRVVMLLRPDELTGVIEQTGSSNGGGNYNNGNGANNGAGNTDNGTGYPGNSNGNGTVR